MPSTTPSDPNNHVALTAAKLMGEVWITQNTRAVYPQEMTMGHLASTIHYLQRGMQRQGCSGFTNEQWIDIFRAEHIRRVGWAP